MFACFRATLDDASDIDRLAREAGLHVDAAHSLGLPQALLFAARAAPDGALLGFLLAWHVADEFELLDLATEPAQRRRGVASALLAELTHTAEQERGVALMLEVRSGNLAARTLYEKHGFQVVYERKNYYRDPVENAVCMRLDLDSSRREGTTP